MHTVNVRKQSHVEAFARLGWRIIGHGWDSLGGFIIMQEA